MTILTCSDCESTADGVQPAIAHVTAFPDHRMKGDVDDEGTTISVSFGESADEDDEDYWDDYEEDDDRNDRR